MWTRGFYMHFMYIISGISHNISISKVNLLLSSFSKWRNWDSEMLSNFPKVSQLVIGDAEIQNQALFPFPEHGGLRYNW